MGELRQAIENNELILYYQPKIDIKQKKIQGVEALVRWQHEKHGLIPPDEFIPLAERTGLIDDLTYWVIRQGMEQLVKWHTMGLKIGIAINVSPSTLLNYDLPDIITGLLARHGISASLITLEITEGSLMNNPARAMEILTRLDEMGINISIDDFGTGYSSLAYLKRLPASEVKIDKTFVMEMFNNENDAVIVKATIDLAHNLGMQVTAEGVENNKIAVRLRKLGCDTLQGYFFSRPCNEKDFIRWVKSQVNDQNRTDTDN
jgi:EAL domain-containing protein (putative c-di-GMP-specific phosphodiesterase class I)